MAGQTACPEEMPARARKRCEEHGVRLAGGRRGTASGCTFEIWDLGFEISNLKFELYVWDKRQRELPAP
jgi:hypothetical protein